MPLLSFSPLKLQKVVCFILFIYSREFNNNVISNGKSYCCNDTFIYVRFTLLLAKNYLYAVRISISLGILSEIFIQIGHFLPRDAMHKRGYCRHAVSVCLSRS